MPSKFATEDENVFQLLGDDFVPQTPYRGSPRIPLGDPSQRRRAIYALEARAPPPDSIATVVNSLQNRVNSITLCITMNAKTGKIILVTLCIYIEWLFCNVRLV